MLLKSKIELDLNIVESGERKIVKFRPGKITDIPDHNGENLLKNMPEGFEIADEEKDKPDLHAIENYEEMHVKSLQKLVKERGLEVEGNTKAEFIAALEAYDENAALEVN